MEAVARKIVTKIEPNPLLINHRDDNALLRVAAYCRVSTDSNDQLESYKAQVAHYTEAIAKNPKWRFVEIYADEGITGTSVKKRDSFKKMIKDCSKGKIDLILTKSVARFARNTLDSLKYVRQLKAQGVGVFFEEQNLDSLKADSEMFIGLHSVLAQAESENISANVRWGIQQRMRSGTFAFRYNILGYRKGEDGEPEIVESEAEVIRKIFTLYLDGCSIDQIKSYLEDCNIRTAKGKAEWSKANIHSILNNERYCGDLMLQKTYTESCITKKVKKNRGEMAKYYISNNHPAIINRTTFKLVQMEINRRGGKRQESDKGKTQKGKYSGKYALTDILVCGECGSPYRRRTWVSNGVSKRVWRCLNRVEHGTEYCNRSITVEDEAIKRSICMALEKSFINNKKALELIKLNIAYAVSGDNDTLDAYAIENQIKELTGEIETSVSLMTNTAGDKKKYMDAIKEYTAQIGALRSRLEIVKDKIKNSDQIQHQLEVVDNIFSDNEISFKTFNDTLIRKLVQQIRIMHDGRLIILLKGGIKIESEIVCG